MRSRNVKSLRVVLVQIFHEQETFFESVSWLKNKYLYGKHVFDSEWKYSVYGKCSTGELGKSERESSSSSSVPVPFSGAVFHGWHFNDNNYITL